MLKLRLSRIGRKNLPYYYIVAVCSKKPLKTRFIDKVGSYDCFRKKATINEEAVLKFLNNGAMPSQTVKNILQKEGIWKKFVKSKPAKKKTNVRPKITSAKRLEKKKRKQRAKNQRRKTRLYLASKKILEQKVEENHKKQN